MGDDETKAMIARIDERTKFIKESVAAHGDRLDEHAAELKSLNRFKYYVHGGWAAIAAFFGVVR